MRKVVKGKAAPEARIEEIRLRIKEISAELRRLQKEWLHARDRRDLDGETRLVGQEAALFKETDLLVREFSDLLHLPEGPQDRGP